MLSDTHPDAERVQIELLRKMTVAERLERLRSLTATAASLSRRAVARARPDLPPRQQELLWVRVHYGDRLAQELEAYWANHVGT